MLPNFDFAPAVIAFETVVSAITEDQLLGATPCGESTVRALLVHVIGLTEAFRQAATEGTPGLFGPVVAAPADAPVLDRVTGRDPAWAR
ncbi:maleylpyruvate isomerase N-terminal domain-containing protein [Nocardia australiensis]|uniref:maleylpyruvate isomerase N-terminal domain-containing protein n=1 Tax=Nocardia australiensis TaxID=2887191 RepID=UPI001D1424EA|nr:maleylpyruvate isomerase N-terminal domain-containing protein [Nocardia australiensis]